MNLDGTKPALILASGQDVPTAPPRFSTDPLVVCADGGAALARLWGLQPAAIVGDQDSLDTETRDYWRAKNIPFYRHPTNKDQTDMDLAVDFALQAGATSIHLVGAWGSRIDHNLGNVDLLYRLALEKIPNQLYTKQQNLSAFWSEYHIDVNKGSIVSLLPLTAVVEHVQSEGLDYPLHGVTVNKGSTLTISNVAEASHVVVKIGTGVLLLVWEK